MPLIHWHEQRFLKTQKANFGKIIYFSLEEIILDSNYPKEKNIRYKCRVVYDAANVEVEFSPYQRKQINKLIIKEGSEIEYSFKYADRNKLNALSENLKDDEEVLIVQNNLLTDTSFTNIALYNGTDWLTPAKPLLQGVQRNYLLSQNVIHEADIDFRDLKNYSEIKLFNALNGWESAWILSCSDILFAV
ncbi:MAG: aminotransferase class IV [Arachidicoccus sp.]|nr:aminotransferase class IV [Arachidicoccus sp.]